ncbi:ESX secretion-associated protein EspG [Williamsia sp. CHRR-6]|uniref:ESX secretion-associated protein EspG n=1 Tax=Williamsia sp. CHRR-6 TaxID=2835871 RepID=UPI001BD9E175|nr:ESX secretion-associated protein EspG [Williamsia sp. CHRR-6]MBT0568577.1 ESX secretion-associated protein EspG [Williamsia sp. CHRR-6]
MIDTTVSFNLDLAEVLALCDELVIQTLPAVLRVEEPCATDHDAATFRAAGHAALVKRGMIDSLGHLDPHLKRIMLAAATPDWIVEMRRIDATQIFRFCVFALEDRRFSAARSEDGFTFADVVDADDEALLVNQIKPLIGAAPGAPQVGQLRMPSEVIDTALAQCVDEVDHMEALFSIGVPESQARAIAGTLATCLGQTEIVVNNGSTSDRGVLAIFDTPRGRVTSLAVKSVSGERWTTIGPGDDHVVVNAIKQIAHNLPGGA